MATEIKCFECGGWDTDPLTCSLCGKVRKVHSTFENQNDIDRQKPFEIPMLVWNKDMNIPSWKRNLINSGKALQWIALMIGGMIAWMAYWIAI